MSEAAAATEAPEGIDRAGVEGWFEANVGGVKLPLAFERIAGGLSNLTYSVHDAAGSAWALRRPPLGARLGSAHDVGREHRVIKALGPTDVPVPPLAGFCEDESVNEAPFYVMEFVEGNVLRTAELVEELTREGDRGPIGERVVETLAAIHAVDPDEVGLGELGRKEDYVGRQLKRWQGQWEKSKDPGEEVPLLDEVHDRLAARIPEQGPATIVHGDYRLDNMILEAPGNEIAAVVDWELCTLGDPLADVGLLLVYWVEPEDQLLPLQSPPTTAPGFPTREDVKSLYVEHTGRDLAEIDYFVALAYWKLAIILQGIVARFRRGAYGDAEPPAEVVNGVQQLATAASDAESRLG